MRLEARRLDYGFPGRVLGRGVDLVLEGAKVVCVLGPNGGGKTSLMRTLLGLLPPLAGQVLLDGRDLATLTARERARLLAYVPQAAASELDFTVREIVAMGRAPHRGLLSAPAHADRMRVSEALERLGIAALAERPVHRLSGGERQLALVARALATEAPCLLMDEPTANLDFGNQALILEEVARLRHGGATVVFSTHDPDHALRIADRAVLLHPGGVVASGPVDEVITSASLTALYGRPVEVVEAAVAGGPPQRLCVSAGRAARG